MRGCDAAITSPRVSPGRRLTLRSIVLIETTGTLAAPSKLAKQRFAYFEQAGLGCLGT